MVNFSLETDKHTRASVTCTCGSAQRQPALSAHTHAGPLCTLHVRSTPMFETFSPRTPRRHWPLRNWTTSCSFDVGSQRYRVGYSLGDLTSPLWFSNCLIRH